MLRPAVSAESVPVGSMKLEGIWTVLVGGGWVPRSAELRSRQHRKMQARVAERPRCAL